ncbi:hypothetical protein J1P26_19930 [Neobacillus sp. MM2021_6]|uniref:hypothetical protein n=1 Tax=Bacillaceae TaxID=186817 RepID=UPI00140CF6E8|nr:MULTISPECIES: hypothetical protein [Bacillaceae]MBO0961978.1 hypothetical protein [Neobacillus sp. MM2021_6]NHC20325.1 hypothetical protein [Bacillus sp. MM2020_4]
MSNLVNWAKQELELIGSHDDEMQQMMNKDILQIVEAFSDQGHSGFSAGYALNLIKRLLDWKPITPLTGEEDEWGEVYYTDKEQTQQNKRCSAVFRKYKDNSTAYYIDGKVFSDDGGETWYTNRDSFVPVTFPYLVPEKPERIVLEK